MHASTLLKCIALAAAVVITPITANAQYQHGGGQCDVVYQRAFDNCRANHVNACDESRRDARRTCRYGNRMRCIDASRRSDAICAARGCRNRAENARAACFNNHRRGYQRGYQRGPRY